MWACVCACLCVSRVRACLCDCTLSIFVFLYNNGFCEVSLSSPSGKTDSAAVRRRLGTFLTRPFGLSSTPRPAPDSVLPPVHSSSFSGSSPFSFYLSHYQSTTMSRFPCAILPVLVSALFHVSLTRQKRGRLAGARREQREYKRVHCTCALMHTYMHTYMYEYIHTYIRASIYTYMHTLIHTDMHIYTYRHTFTLGIIANASIRTSM